MRYQGNSSLRSSAAIESIDPVGKQLSIDGLRIQELYHRLVTRIVPCGVNCPARALADQGFDPVSWDFGEAHFTS